MEGFKISALGLIPIVMALASNVGGPAQRDITTFVARRDKCDHFRGEEAYDKVRARQLKRQVARYCKGTDRQLARLKHKYEKNTKVTKILSRYEDNVE